MHIDRFITYFKKPHRTPKGWQVLCPAHDDSNNSLSIGIGSDNKIIMKCHAGCDNEDILSSIGLKISDLFQDELKPNKVYTGTEKKETEYKYYDENGEYYCSAVRIDIPGEKKTFIARIGNKKTMCGKKPILYNLHKVKKAIVNEEIILLPEGEKQCDNIEKHFDMTATTNMFGAGKDKWKPEYSDTLTWANVVILPDNDDPGQLHCETICETLPKTAKTLKVLNLPGLPIGGDISDWIAAGGTKEQLLKLIEDTPIYKPPKKKTEKDNFYYDKDKKEYLYHNGKCWLSLNEGQFKKNLENMGYKSKKFKGQTLSEVDMHLIDLRENNHVDYVGGLAGYPKGFYMIDEKRLLVNQGPKLIYPKEGKFDMIDKIIDNLLFDMDETDEKKQDLQLIHFILWLKIAYESLMYRTFRPGQVLILAGERECGKSLLQKIITELLGGRSARPYKFMTDKSEFNADLFEAEHLIIEDEVAMTGIKERRQFGNKIKQFAANDSHRCRAMYRDAMELKPFWRVSISLNDEPENLLILPPMDESLVDKMIILRAFKKPMPMNTSKNEDRIKFWQKIKEELPAFAYYLTTLKIPEDKISERYGVTHFHNEYILGEISLLSPENKLLDLIDICLFKDDFTQKNEFELTARDLEMKLITNNDTKYGAEKLLSHPTTCGTYLGRLAKKTDRVEQIRKANERLWKIKRKV